MAGANDGGRCRECRGTGRVVLLTSSAPCAACAGTGGARSVAGVPPRPAGGAAGRAGAAAVRVTSETAYDLYGRAVSITRRGYDEGDRPVWESTQFLATGDDVGGIGTERPGPECVLEYHYDARGHRTDGGAGPKAQGERIFSR